MKAKFSPYLTHLAQFFRELSRELSKTYNYVSILSTDSVGLSIRISQRAKSVSSETMTTERGNVVRVHQNGLYSEYAFNDLDLEDILRKANAKFYKRFTSMEKICQDKEINFTDLSFDEKNSLWEQVKDSEK